MKATRAPAFGICDVLQAVRISLVQEMFLHAESDPF